MSKKLISVLLVAILAMTVMAVPVSADPVIAALPLNINTNFTCNQNTIYVVNPGTTVTIAENATLTCTGTALIKNMGTVTNNGNIVGTPITNEGAGVVYHRVHMPDPEVGKYTIWYYDQTQIDPEDNTYIFPEYNLFYYEECNASTILYAEQGKTFNFTFKMNSPAYDMRKLEPNVNGTAAQFIGGFIADPEPLIGDPKVETCSIFTIPSAYSSFTINVMPWNADTMRKTITIPLPRDIETGSFRVVATYRGIVYENEVKVAYGDTFIFAVELDPLYDRSKLTVSLGGKKVTPNENGFYVVTNVTDADGKADLKYEISIAGVLTNESQMAMQNAIALFQDIMRVIMDILDTFFAMFGIDIKVPSI